MEAISPEQVKVLDAHIPHTESYKKQQADIKKLEENDAEIIGELDILMKGQANLRREMSEHSAKIGALDTKVDDMAKSLKDDIKELGQNIVKKIEDREMSELRTEIRTLKKKEEKDEAKQWDLVKIVSAAIVGVIVTFLGIKLLGGQ